MTYEEQTVLNHLRRWHLGRARAITYKNLALVLKMDARTLRDTVSRLVTEHNALIASTSSDGYFYIQTEEELNHAKNEIISRVRKLAARKRGLVKGWTMQFEPQRTLF